MRITAVATTTVGLVLACGGVPEQPADVATAQAGLTGDTAQAQLWERAAQTDAAVGAATLHTDSGVVSTRAPLRVPDRPVQATERPFPEEVDGALVMLAVPEIEGAFTGAATVRAVSGEFLTLDLGQDRLLRIQAKVAGGPLRVQSGESARVYLRSSGDPFARDDILSLRFEGDEVLYALVGGNQPVRFRVAAPALGVAQTGEPDGNTMPVVVTVGSERQTLRLGEQADFARARLTVRLLASTAIQGEAAYAVEGDPYRVQLLAWRTRGQ